MRGSGVLSDSDLALAHRQMETDPAADPAFARICDLSDVTDVSVSSESLDAWAADPISNPIVWHAIICSTSRVLERVLEYVRLSRKQSSQVAVFPTYEQAADWIRRNQWSDMTGNAATNP